MSAAIEDGVVAARVVEPITYGPGKVEALRRSARGAKVIGAFGDSLYDLPMLCDATLGVTVRPKPELREKAAAQCQNHRGADEKWPHPARSLLQVQADIDAERKATVLEQLEATRERNQDLEKQLDRLQSLRGKAERHLNFADCDGFNLHRKCRSGLQRGIRPGLIPMPKQEFSIAFVIALNRFDQAKIGMRAIDDIGAARAAAAGAAIRVGLLAQQRLRKMQRQNALPDAAASGDQQRVRPARTRLQRCRRGFALPRRQGLPQRRRGFASFDHSAASLLTVQPP